MPIKSARKIAPQKRAAHAKDRAACLRFSLRDFEAFTEAVRHPQVPTQALRKLMGRGSN